MDITSHTKPFKNTKKQQFFLGQQVLAEFFECDSNILNNQSIIEKLMVKSALESGATVVQKCFHMFSPYGVSGVVIIAESHFAIHTWPELGYAAVDIFTCGDKCNPLTAYNFLKEKFHSKRAHFTRLKRGVMNKKESNVKIKIIDK